MIVPNKIKMHGGTGNQFDSVRRVLIRLIKISRVRLVELVLDLASSNKCSYQVRPYGSSAKSNKNNVLRCSACLLPGAYSYRACAAAQAANADGYRALCGHAWLNIKFIF